MMTIGQKYTVLKTYEVYHFENYSQYDPKTNEQGLFSEQVDVFLKKKMESLGYPNWIHSEKDKDDFIKDIHEKNWNHVD